MEGLAALAVLIGLYGWIPYNFGFESKARPVLEMLYRFWTDPSTTDWHHGMIVPLISLGLVIHQWKDLQKVPIRPCGAGIPVVLAALGLFWVGYKIDITIVGFMSLQLMVGGVLLWLLGWSMMKELMFPYTFLLFAYPFYFLESRTGRQKAGRCKGTSAPSSWTNPGATGGPPPPSTAET